ncbi:hypothetical protein [Luteimonas sp. SDU82]|uniref:hypothetical protein n=3 Tax=unclassified Luteimonas TaxID=2629088 RepID=UPI003EB972B9
MPLTIGLAGMDPATETALKAAFLDANQRLGESWQLLPETQADHIVVDMDSMYGPMSWLRLHASGKRVVGLTSAARAQTDFRLGRPFSADSLTALLREIAAQDGAPVAPDAPTAPQAPAVETAAAPQPAPAAVPEPASAAPQAAAPEVAPEAAPAAAIQAPEPTTLFGRLAAGTLTGQRRYRRPSGPTLLIDAEARSYHGPAALKPLLPYFEGELAEEALEPVDAETFQREAEAVGPAQPLSRLLWLGALASGQGQLLPGHDPEAKYRLNRWPQTEREFPRHFRIATAMMKAPSTLAEVAAASGIALGEIVDFVNANLATGVAEAVVEAPPEPAAQPRAGGLLGRLRGR